MVWRRLVSTVRSRMRSPLEAWRRWSERERDVLREKKAGVRGGARWGWGVLLVRVDERGEAGVGGRAGWSGRSRDDELWRWSSPGLVLGWGWFEELVRSRGLVVRERMARLPCAGVEVTAKQSGCEGR